MTRAILFAALPLLAACAATSAAPRLIPSEWRFVRIDGVQAVAARTSLRIADDRIGANVGCNGMGGDLKIDQGRLMVGALISTKMWCDGVMDQELAVQQLLSAAPEYHVQKGMLTLIGGQHTAELEAAR